MKKTKHIAFFISSLHIGGVENVFLTYANKLSDLGYKVDFIVCKSGGELQVYLSKKISLIDLGGIKLWKAVFPLRTYLKQQKPEIVISGPDFPNFILILASMGLRNKLKIIVSQHNYMNLESKKLGLYGRITPLLIYVLYQYADKIMVVSEGLRQLMVSNFRFSSDKVVCIYNPVNITQVREKAFEKITFKYARDYIVFVGRLSVVKNLHLLLRAFDFLGDMDLDLVIVGAGECSEQLVAETLNKKVHFLGSMSNPLPIMQHAKAIILPSYSEAFPVVLIEALVLNKTVVSTPTNGAKEILNNGEYGYLSTSFDNPIEFSKLIRYAIKCPIDMKFLNRSVMKYDINSIICKFESVLLK